MLKKMADNHKALYHRLWLIALFLLMLGLVGLFISSLKDGYDEKLARASTDSENMARVLEEQAKAFFMKSDVLLEHIADDVTPKPGKGWQTPEALHAYLKRHRESLPEAFRIRVIKPNGYSLASSSETDGSLYYGDRSYFTRHRDNPSPALFISEPIVGRTHQGWQLMVSRRLSHADGSFAGVISAAIELAYFEAFFGSLQLGKNSNITLLSTDLYVITRFPISESQRLKSLRGAQIEKEIRKNPYKGTYISKSAVDGVERVFSYRRVGDLPLIVNVGLSKQEILTEWRSNAFKDGVMMAVLLAAIGLLSYYLMKGYRLVQESRQQLKKITSTLGEGVYVLDQHGLVTFVNPEAERLLGWRAEELQGRNGHDLFHYKRPDGSPLPYEHCPVHQSIRSGHVHRVDQDWLIRKDGSFMPVSLVSSPIIEEGVVKGSVAAFQDISSRLEAERALRESEERYRLLFNSGNDAVMVHRILDKGPGPFIEVNDVACYRLGYPRAELLTMCPADIDDPETHLDMAAVMQKLLTSRYAVFERVHVARNGTKIPVEISSHLFDMDGHPTVLSVVRDISERKQAEAQIRQLAFYDTLTNLPNRRMLMDRLNQALGQAQRYHRALAIMFLDLDRFKNINDTLGHDVGDELLKTVAARLIASVRVGDTVSRQGGDEFVVVLAEIARPQDAAVVAEKIIKTLAQPVVVNGIELQQVTTSIGIAVYPVAGVDNAVELMKKADLAMYAVKEAGRNGYRFFHDSEDVLDQAKSVTEE